MSIMIGLPRPSIRPWFHSRSSPDVPPTVFQPSSSNRSAKRKRDDSPHRKPSTVKKYHHVHQARQSLITSHYPTKSILFPFPPHTLVNAVTHSPLSPSLSAPSVPKPKDKDHTLINGNHNGLAQQRSTQYGVEVGEKMEEKRSLRSHDGGSRSKCELAQYFANYEEILSLEPRETDSLAPDTRLYITDNTAKSSPPKLSRVPTTSHDGSYHVSKNSRHDWVPASLLSKDEAFIKNGIERIDLAIGDRPFKLPRKDPLSDSLYFKAHRRAQRQEKSARNIEKEHAMHEKVQLETLLEGLRGHDWLKVMGISGITDSEKRLYEDKRKYFIREVRILIEKFRLWKEEEKRRKVVKIKEEDEDIPENQSLVGSRAIDPCYKRPGSETSFLYVEEADAKAAQQLQQEATASSGLPVNRHPPTRKRPRAPSVVSSLSASKPTENLPATPSDALHQPFGSFFQKTYQRDAALGSHRRGRARLAFGQPVPEPRLIEFDLTDEILTPEIVTALERKRRVFNRDKTCTYF